MEEREVELTIADNGVAEYNFNIEGTLKILKVVPEEMCRFNVYIITKEGIPLFKKEITKPEMIYLAIQPHFFDERSSDSRYSTFGTGDMILNDEVYVNVTGSSGKKITLIFRWKK